MASAGYNKCTMAEIVADIAIHRRISCYSVGLKMLCLVGVNLEDLVGNHPLCTMAPIYLLIFAVLFQTEDDGSIILLSPTTPLTVKAWSAPSVVPNRLVILLALPV